MSTPILATKLYIPPPRPKVVLRPGLIERLNEGLHRKLTLISAPAGFGKTTLVSEWVADGERPAAWLSLDDRDNDPTRFMAYFVAALQTITANIGEGILSVLQSAQPPTTEWILTALLNEITTIPDNFILVLDDFHLIEFRPIHDTLTFLLDRLPPQMHLVIITREEPQLPLARLRAQGQLTELRAADLRFTAAEAAGFLNHMMGLNLSANDINALETRTEGWIAGLQLAAISMQGRADSASFIQSFSGSHHFVLDYLVEEVLQQQPESVQTFLLYTSIFDRLSGPLCDAVLPDSSASGQETLKYIEQANLFIVPLDNERHWYRYHHLFADVLQARLMKEQPNQVLRLHLRASEWYEYNDLPFDAIQHALAGEDFERAAGLIELAWSATLRGGFQGGTWPGWVKALPDELVRARPVLSVGYALTLLTGGEIEAGEARLWDAERWLDIAAGMSESSEVPSSEMVVTDEAEFRLLPATIATARIFLAQAFGDMAGTMKYARRALDLLPADDYFLRAIPAGLLGFAYWASGDLEAAYQSLTDARASMQMTGNIAATISGTSVLAYIKAVQGRLHEAVRLYERSLQLAAAQGEPAIQGTADLYLGFSELHLELGDLEAAKQHLLTSEALGEQAAFDAYQYRWRVARARLKEVQGDLDGALDLLDEAEGVYTGRIVPNVRPVAALKARVWIAQGQLTEALTWMHDHGLSIEDDLSYLREFEHITLVKLFIAQYRKDGVNSSIQQATGLLERLLQAAEAGGRIGSVIEILVLQALAHHAQGDIPAALVPLERALTLAEPEGYVRVFVDEGPPMLALLQEAAEHGIAPDYVSQLRAAFGKAEGKTPAAQRLIEPLSERELDVLKLLGTELTGPEIARELMVSLNTMRTHTKNIYTKLEVNNRQAAIRRAEELDLL